MLNPFLFFFSNRVFFFLIKEIKYKIDFEGVWIVWAVHPVGSVLCMIMIVNVYVIIKMSVIWKIT